MTSNAASELSAAMKLNARWPVSFLMRLTDAVVLVAMPATTSGSKPKPSITPATAYGSEAHRTVQRIASSQLLEHDLSVVWLEG